MPGHVGSNQTVARQMVYADYLDGGSQQLPAGDEDRGWRCSACIEFIDELVQ